MPSSPANRPRKRITASLRPRHSSSMAPSSRARSPSTCSTRRSPRRCRRHDARRFQAIDNVHFSKLRISGFKSFVDATELVIEPGLTGIVGPNGCGKSNLVEALRWVMGENSAKRMRGGEMDDVIFGGTSTRPARNLAEVALLVDNEGQEIPLPFASGSDLEIVRRIERGEGS